MSQKPSSRDRDLGAVGATVDPAADARPWRKPESFDLRGVLSAVGETAYTWDLASDRLDWADNAQQVLGEDVVAEIATGAALERAIDAEHIQRRREALTSPGSASYRIHYRLLHGGNALWIEERGCFGLGPAGDPHCVRGVLRTLSQADVEALRNDRDELTGQLNRPALMDALRAVLSRRQSAALLIASVNNLGVINETFGFDVGDEVLAATARMLRSRLRSGDALGRYSANKFGLVLEACSDAAGMRSAAERFIASAREHTVTTRACPIAATISVGGVLLPDQAADPDEALSRGLSALERARQRRFDCFMSYEPSASGARTRRRSIAVADEIVGALRDDRMRLALQPVVSARTRRPAFHEALLRLQRADGTVVAAGEFILVAEQLGLSRLIDRRTLELAVGLLERRPELRLALNVSGLTTSDHDWLVALHRLTGGDRCLTERLTIEITETAASEDLDQAIAFVDSLKELGCRVAMDDFGAGYTSFKNLKLLDIDMVKIDGAFVENLRQDASDRVFIKTLVELAQAFGLETVAEWVGDDATAAILARSGITYLQGYHFGRPQPACELDARFGAAQTPS